MNEELIKQIADYIDFLRGPMGLQVSVCKLSCKFAVYGHYLQPYNAHVNRYCEAIKADPDAFGKCVNKQFAVLEHGDGTPFYGVCWAGVEEFVFPVTHAGAKLAFISVSGYRGHLPQAKNRVIGAASRLGADADKLLLFYEKSLSSEVPPLEKVRALVMPLCRMFELLYLLTPESANKRPVSACSEIINFLCDNFTRKLTLDGISRELHYSKSYIRHLFQQNTSKTIGAYITELRVSRAKQLLLSTSMSISEIAFETGFSDPNYFTNVFRRFTGQSPSLFRKRVSEDYRAMTPSRSEAVWRHDR